uniref:Uncharacterized protein n=1 Tax=Timema monikensis TaxID=170555 RepID=A0A7R9EH76_9NEOP|nr:unnamed protein product [Timema monikensis]
MQRPLYLRIGSWRLVMKGVHLTGPLKISYSRHLDMGLEDRSFVSVHVAELSRNCSVPYLKTQSMWWTCRYRQLHASENEPQH